MLEIAIIFAVMIGITHYYSEKFCLKCKAFGGVHKVVSLFAGIAVTYILLDLFPLFSEKVLATNKLLFLSLLFGFVIFHLIEKITYQKAPKGRLRKEIALEESLALFVYHFLIGIAFVSFATEGLFEGLLFFVPILLYTSISAFVARPIRNRVLKVIFASGALLGVLFAGFLYPNSINPMIELAFLGFVIGALFYIIMRHSIPAKGEGKPLYFLLGAIIYSALIIASWFA
ncbi:hypothetical protein ACFLZZ_03495 [Nanoarchaeota archaeon]